MKVIDLSHLIHKDMMVYPGTEKPMITLKHNIEDDGFRENQICIFSHVGTHIDAPSHMISNGKYLSNYDVSKFIGKAIILDFSGHCNSMIEVNDIKIYERRIKEVDFLILNTGWHKYWGQKRYLENYPILSLEAVQWLTKFNLKGIGVDAISIDSIDSEDFYAHNILLKAEFIIIENLTNLYEVYSDIFTLSVLPLKYEKADGSPVRAIAII